LKETSGPTFNELIRRFEVPLPDNEFPSLVAALGEEARRKMAGTASIEGRPHYAYVLGRTYELLGYCARHTPWLSNSPKSYWHRAVVFFERAVRQAAENSAQRLFLNAKINLRNAMIFTLDRNSERAADSLALLVAAERLFAEAADKEKDRELQSIYRDASVIAQSEARQRILRAEIKTLLDQASSRTWPAIFEQMTEKVVDFPAQAFADLPSSRSVVASRAQEALAKARKLFAQAHTLEDYVAFLRKNVPNDHAKVAQDFIDVSEVTIRTCYDESAKLCAEAGLTVRAAHTEVTKLRRTAEASLKDCVHQFKAVRMRESKERDELLRQTVPLAHAVPAEIVELLNSIVALQSRGRATEEFLTEFERASGVRLDEDANVFNESADVWIVSDGFYRFLVHKTGEGAQVTDLAKQPIPFNAKEAEIFNKYASTVWHTCELYTQAIRHIYRALREASGLYDQMTKQLRKDTDAIRDPDLISLYVSTNSILEELQSRHYPLLSALRDRIRYVWSLLEMFQMRHGAVRLGTLFSAQCRLVMRNPFYDGSVDLEEDEYLEVGADPIFQTTVDFIFRGAKGEEDRHDFQRRALTATLDTINQQEQSLVSEMRYVDELDPEARRALIERLRCHRNVALALREFTPVFQAQRPFEMPTSEIERRLRAINDYLNNATMALDAAEDSRLIDRAGLDVLRDWMKGIGQVLVGMNRRKEGDTRWVKIYRDALKNLLSAKERLERVGDVDLLPAGPKRAEYQQYIEARILTVEAWQARYRAEGSGLASDFAKSAEYFEQSARIFRDTLRDYRVATKAAARALEMRSRAVEGTDAAARSQRYLLLKEANALYAACGDAMGFNATSERLRDEFPFEEPAVAPPLIPQNSAAATEPDAITERRLETFGPFEVQLIQIGGMAIVYRTRKDGKDVALKRLKEDYKDDDNFILRFLREVAICEDLNHPNIVRTFDHGEVEGIPYFLMEFLNGQTLKDALHAGRFDVRGTAKIIKQIAEALDYAHNKGIVHRDMKPSNVMLVDGGQRVKVLDFGIAYTLRFARSTIVGTFIGTPDYASPEQIELREVEAQSDLYSLGLIMYEMLTGQRALEYKLRTQQDHPAPSAAARDIPPQLDAMVIKLLACRPAERYASAALLIRDLRSFVGLDAAD
jgi:tRNA A-37 threonylcarbamoyl transferase component Bud32